MQLGAIAIIDCQFHRLGRGCVYPGLCDEERYRQQGQHDTHAPSGDAENRKL